jgi:hypothetical protein
MNSFKVGDKVQFINWSEDKPSLKDGELVAVIPPKKKRSDNYWALPEAQRAEMETCATVKWEDNTQSDIRMDLLTKRDSEIEREFRKMATQILDEIQEKVSVAAAYLHEAVELSEKHGVPFYSSLSQISQSYIPTTFSTQHGDIDPEIVEAITSTSIGYDHDRGWAHSAIC